MSLLPLWLAPLVLSAPILAANTATSLTNCDGPLPVIISFEGGIGCGKSTALKLAAKMQDVLGIANISSWPEPETEFGPLSAFWPLAHEVDKLRAMKLSTGTDLQERVNAAALTVQTVVHEALANRHKEALAWACAASKWGRPVVLLERTTGTQNRVFAPLLHDQGYLTAAGLEQIVNTMPTENPPNTSLFFVISPAKVMERIRGRHRDGEGAVNEDLVKALDVKHAEYVKYITSIAGPGAARMFDASGSKAEVLSIVTGLIFEVLHRQKPSLEMRLKIRAAADVAVGSEAKHANHDGYYVFALATAIIVGIALVLAVLAGLWRKARQRSCRAVQHTDNSLGQSMTQFSGEA